MSPLPQRKKSPEEIQQLRGQLGIPQEQTLRPGQQFPAAKKTPPPTTEADPKEIEKQRQAAAARRAKLEKRITRSFKRSEWEAPNSAARTVPQATAPQDTTIPIRKHSQAELEEMHRRDVLAQIASKKALDLVPKAAPLPVLVAGYLLALSGTACHFRDDIPLEITAGAGILAIAIAGWIYFHRKLSSHHSGFIAIITLLVFAFAALHYFPQLQHAT